MLLRGIRVLSMEQAVAAPFCTSKLADMGARVIKVEKEKGGDFARSYDTFAKGSSSYFAWLNRGKESLAVDIKQEKDLLLKMIDEFDVFVENLAPGAAARAGFDPVMLQQRNPRLICLSISGYGQCGPKKDYKAYDLLVSAEAGLCDITGHPEGPGRVGISICDLVTGMNGYSAILQGLYERERTGKGSIYHVSLFDSIAELMSVPYLQQKYTGVSPQRVGLKHPSIAPYGSYSTKDHKSILVAIQNEEEWKRLCRNVLQNPGMVEDPRFECGTRRVECRFELDNMINEAFMQNDFDYWAERMLENKIAFSRLNSVKDFVEHPHLRSISYKTEQNMDIFVPAPAIQPSPSNTGNVPKLGEHNNMIRKEFQTIG